MINIIVGFLIISAALATIWVLLFLIGLLGYKLKIDLTGIEYDDDFATTTLNGIAITLFLIGVLAVGVLCYTLGGLVIKNI